MDIFGSLISRAAEFDRTIRLSILWWRQVHSGCASWRGSRHNSILPSSELISTHEEESKDKSEHRNECNATMWIL